MRDVSLNHTSSSNVCFEDITMAVAVAQFLHLVSPHFQALHKILKSISPKLLKKG